MVEDEISQRHAAVDRCKKLAKDEKKQQSQLKPTQAVVTQAPPKAKGPNSTGENESWLKLKDTDKQPDLGKVNVPWPQRKFEGYYKISRHYKWALNQIFHTFNHSAVIIVEDDLDISPDFYEYFAATFRVLHQDSSLWCVSAFWDDWMRHPDQRQGRSCIRPELSRTSTFGKKGVSKGLFFEKHLKFIQLNDKVVPFTQRDLSYLIKENYDPKFVQYIYNLPEVTASEVKAQSKKALPEVRVTYKTKEQFKDAAKKLGIMDDFKAGVERTAYMGVVSFSYQGQRVHVAPPSDWAGYDTTWS
ncbi:MGAT1-like protein [Mya arenaria]|uniref:Alpha-1,3-mannosyl-glycoprotein 2-beta-N-acetylglucosaminyltransferase n=1 Tax=Mya arenaria TaxID=6604 RepID=A0ABY7G613_MYAAR|nr:MGAT1-like protein [Mya arenaria]